MNAIDFSYDGQYLSDYNFIIANITQNDMVTTINPGSKINFNKISKNGGKLFSLSSTNYADCFGSTFEICKNPEKCDDMHISPDEFRDMVRWLNRREFLKFYFINDYEEAETQFFNASFNYEKIMLNDYIIGISLTMITDSPFGYGQDYTNTLTVAETNKVFTIADISDEIGATNLEMEIKINRAGDLQIYNITQNRTTEIKDCRLNETIKIHGKIEWIETDANGHDLSKDFNYVFPQICNTIKDRNNKFTFSLPCRVKINYTPIIK